MITRTLLTALLACSGLWAISEDPTDSATGKVALERFNGLVGQWKGTGQPRRGSNRGAWREKTSVAWNFKDKRPAILITADGSKQFESLQLTVKQGRLVARQKQGDAVIEYTAPLSDTWPAVSPTKWPAKIVLTSKVDEKGVTYRCTLQQLSDIRATILLEKQSSPTGSFRRLAGVGYTREGERLAQVGGTSRKCIVTGGLGTIAVSHKGKTYYVCCQGCVQAFNDAPDEIIAEYQASLKK
ncbi:MAG: hypothetical protein NXI04_26155 [Planctomycetaceae bacterium]|nr:hypothetical protein [Planctomycetaceae bacterium]